MPEKLPEHVPKSAEKVSPSVNREVASSPICGCSFFAEWESGGAAAQPDSTRKARDVT